MPLIVVALTLIGLKIAAGPDAIVLGGLRQLILQLQHHARQQTEERRVAGGAHQDTVGKGQGSPEAPEARAQQQAGELGQPRASWCTLHARPWQVPLTQGGRKS